MKVSRYFFPVVAIFLAVLLLGGLPFASAQDAAPDAVDAALGTTFTYQGNLKKSGQAVSANCSFQFSLWDALTGGTQQGATKTVSSVPVQAGLFTAQLDFGKQFAGDARWLETAVKCPSDAAYVALTPRQPLNAVPYAIGLRPGAVMKSAALGDAFYVEKNAEYSNAIHGKATADHGTGVLGESTLWAGVWGESAGASGVVGMSAGLYSAGVWGQNTGKGYGVYGQSPDSVGVVGESTNWIGVFGTSGKGTGVWGQAGGTGTIGVKGVADGTGSVGVWGQSAANTGVYGQSGAAGGAALWGNNTAGGIALKAEGNAVQSRDMAGLPKAMIFVSHKSIEPTITRCYNGLTGSVTGGCGFTVSWLLQGTDGNNSISVVDFGFKVDDRFVVANFVSNDGIDYNRVFQIRALTDRQVTLANWKRSICPGLCSSRPQDFFILVY